MNAKMIVILIVVLAAVCFALNLTDEFSVFGRPVIDLLFLFAALNLFVYIAVRTNQAWTSKWQLGLLGVFVITQVTVFACIRLDGVYGNGRPILAWRWAPVATSQKFFPGASAEVEFNFLAKQIWPGFRGSDRTGAIDGRELESWSSKLPEKKWAIDVGVAWSSFALASDPKGGGVCITQEQRGKFESVVCYDIATGKTLWVHQDETRFKEFTAGEGPRATPTIDGERVFALGATGILNCLGLRTGEVIWSRSILDEFEIENRIFGMVGSPLVIDGKVIVTLGGKGTSVMALSQKSGELVWKAGDQVTSYCSPQIISIGDRRCVLHFGGDGLSFHSLQDGSVVFKSISWVSNLSEKNNVCQPIVVPSMTNPSISYLFVSSGYGQGSALFELDGTLQREAIPEASEVWHNQKLKSKFSSIVEYQGHVYGLDNGIMACIEIATCRSRALRSVAFANMESPGNRWAILDCQE